MGMIVVEPAGLVCFSGVSQDHQGGANSTERLRREPRADRERIESGSRQKEHVVYKQEIYRVCLNFESRLAVQKSLFSAFPISSITDPVARI